MGILDPEAKNNVSSKNTCQTPKEGEKPEATGGEKGRKKKEESKETRGENHKRQKRKLARHYFIFFALLLDVKSCPGLLP